MIDATQQLPMRLGALVWLYGKKGYVMDASTPELAVIRVYKAQHTPDNFDDITTTWDFVHPRIGTGPAAQRDAYPEHHVLKERDAEIKAVFKFQEALWENRVFLARKSVLGGNFFTENVTQEFGSISFVCKSLGIDVDKLRAEDDAQAQQIRWSQGIE